MLKNRRTGKKVLVMKQIKDQYGNIFTTADGIVPRQWKFKFSKSKKK